MDMHFNINFNMCLVKPSTPDKTENSSYIVESLSPNASPRKHVSKEAMGKEDGESNDKRNNSFHSQEDRNKIKDHPYKNVGSKIKQMKSSANVGKVLYNEKDSKTDINSTLQKYSRPIIKGDLSLATTFQRTQTSESKLYGPYETTQRSSNFLGKHTAQGRDSVYDRYKGSYHPSFDRNKLATREYKSSDTPIVYGSASLRLERLKKQLMESHLNKYQRPSSAWLENSSEKKWQTEVVKQRSRLDDRRIGGPSHAFTTTCSRESNFSDNGSGLSRARNLDSTFKSFSSDTFSVASNHVSLSEVRVKPYFIKDYCHSKDPNKTKCSLSSYSDSFSRTVGNGCSQFQSPLVKKSCSNSEPCSYSSVFDKKCFLNTSLPVSSSNAFRNDALAKYVSSNEEHKRQIADRCKSYLPQSKQSSFVKPDIASFLKTKTVNPLVTYPRQQVELYKNTGSVNDAVHSVELGGRFLPEVQSLCRSKTPASDRLQLDGHGLLQVSALRKQQLGDSSQFPLLKYSNIGSFASASEKLYSGKNYVKETSSILLKDNSYGIQKKRVENLGFEDLPSNYSSLKNNGKNVEADFKRRDVNSKLRNCPSPKLVREYNHKRIAGYSEKNPIILHDNTKKYAGPRVQIELKKEELPLKTRRNIRSPLKRNIVPSLSSSYLKYGHQMPLPSDDDDDDEDEDEDKGWSLNKAVQKNMKPGSMVQKYVCHTEKEYSNKVNVRVNCNIKTGKDYHEDCVNSATNLTEKDQNNSYNSDRFSIKVTKQKSHDSKGGITRINRKVQKQLRTVAPKLLHLSVACIQKKGLGFTLKNEHMLNQTHKTANTIKDEEEMDWEPIEPEKVVLQVEALRKEGGLQNDITPELKNLCNKNIEISSQWFVVLDTNVLLSHLDFLHELRDIEDKELGMPTLFIPWVVLQELDGLKSTNRKAALQYFARKAVNFLFDNLSVSHPRVQGQPKVEADKYRTLEPDDSILQCSLNLQELSTKVLLLTNDHNLFNKAVVNGVECCSAAKLVQELEHRRSSSKSISVRGTVTKSTLSIYSAVETLKQCLEHVLEEVLRTEMVLAYDRKWSEIVARKPPWTLNDILFCLLKHWVAVFHLVLPSAARELIEKIRIFLNNEEYEISLENVENMVKTCTSLMHLVSSLSYKQYVDTALSTLNKLQQTLEEQKKVCAINSSSASNSLASTTNKADDAVTIISSTTEHSASDSRSFVTQKGEKTKCTGSIISSKGCGGSRIMGNGSKVDADEDCLSLYASSFSEDISNNKPAVGCSESGPEIAHKYLNTIFEKVVIYCGMLCEVMGVEPCAQYQRPEPFPTVETLNQNILSYIKCVSSLLRCMEGILEKQPSELDESSPVLINFCTTIKESIPTWHAFEEPLLVHHVLAYCTQKDTRYQLEFGKKQFEQFQAVLSQALNFFMVQNQSNVPLPSF